MTLIRLYLDEDSMDWVLVNALRSRGIDIVTVQEIGAQGYQDDQQLNWATNQKRVLYSHNIADFCRLHSEWLKLGKFHSGIALMAQDTAIGDQVRGITGLVSLRTAEAMVNQLLFLRQFISG
jgi:predicted nuclease of predicted toxin-antitoxin system